MKVINLDKNFCKELVRKFHKDLYYKRVVSEPEVEEESHISEWLQSMITSQSCATVCSGTLEFRRTLLVLVDSSVEEPTPELDATQIFGGVVLEYYEQFNCGVIKFLDVLQNNRDVHRDQSADCRLLMEEAFSVFSQYSEGDKFQVYSRCRKPDFDCVAKNKEILKRQHQLYGAGFRLVKLQSFGNALGDAEMQHFYTHHVLTVYQPQLVPNYQVENGITSGFVPSESVMNICKIFNSPVSGDRHPDDIEVVSIFPWWDHLGPTRESQIAVVGAGVAGLAAAASLCQAGYNVVLLEAANYIGGRVKQVQPFDGFPPIDLGGEFIHGSDSIINKLAKKNNWRVTPGYNIGEDDAILYLNGRLHPMRQGNPEVQTAYKAWDQIVYFGGKQNDEEKRTMRTAMDDLVKAIGEEQCQMSRDECLQAQTVSSVNQIGVCELSTKQTAKDRWSLMKCRNSKDSCVYNWLVENSYSAQVIDIIDAKEGQNWATSLKSLGVCESSREEDNWCYGSENFRLEGSYSQLVKHYLDDCEMVEKRLNWQVKDIVWKDDPTKNMSGRKCQESIFIKNQHGETLEAEYAIVTVPLTVLKDDDIQFIPSLPASKQIAISSIHMGGALKIVCRFTKPFWPPSFRTLYAVSGFISQIWFYSRDPVSCGPGSEQLEGDKCHLATGFATDEWADRIRHMEEEQLCRRFLQQLDEMFRSENDAMPASGSFISHVYYDWNKNPYVRGGYSSPTVHACGMREELAKPLDDRIFFAGEATNVRVASTVQAAIETGMRAAEEVCRSCERKESRADVLSS